MSDLYTLAFLILLAGLIVLFILQSKLRHLTPGRPRRLPHRKFRSAPRKY